MQLGPSEASLVVIRRIQHLPDQLLGGLDVGVNLVFVDHLLVLANVVQVQLHDFPLQFLFLVVDLLHVRLHELIDVQVFFTGPNGRRLVPG